MMAVFRELNSVPAFDKLSIEDLIWADAKGDLIAFRVRLPL